MYQGGVGFPRISNRCSIEFLRIFYGLSTQPHAFTVLTRKGKGRHCLLWRTNTVANNQRFQRVLCVCQEIHRKSIKHPQEIHRNSPHPDVQKNMFFLLKKNTPPPGCIETHVLYKKQNTFHTQTNCFCFTKKTHFSIHPGGGGWGCAFFFKESQKRKQI